MVEYAIPDRHVDWGTKTKTSEGNGVPKGWLALKGNENNYRRNDLTEPSLFATISLEAMKARDERLALAIAKSKED